MDNERDQRSAAGDGVIRKAAQLEAQEVTAEELKLVAEKTCIPEESVHSMPFPVTPDMVVAAIVAADKIGAAFKEA